MPGAVPYRRLAPLLVLVALLAAAPRAATTAATPDRSRPGAALDRAHAFAVAEIVATPTTSDDRRPLPLGALPTILATALVAGLVAVVVRTHRLPTARRRTDFRRRAPPLLRTAS
jgi:hypothetical protein